MDQTAARRFIEQHARPVDLAVYRCLLGGGPKSAVEEALSAYQNADGGFGHGLEADLWNPNSSPIATNDALLTLLRVDALDAASPLVRGAVRYLASGDSFDADRHRWRFAIDSNRDYPHAVWWEKKGDGIRGFNPTMSLAAFMAVFGDGDPLYRAILAEGASWLGAQEELIADDLKCFLFAWTLLTRRGLADAVDLPALQALLRRKIAATLCADTSKYGVEYVPAPSDLFAGCYLDFLDPEISALAAAEKAALGRLQQEDGGFDISWAWHTDYPTQFAAARAQWRPRRTLDKLLFDLSIH